MARKKIKKLSIKQKLNKKIAILVAELDEAKENESYYRGKYDSLKLEMEEKSKKLSMGIGVVERNENQVVDERNYLRDLVRLLVVPKGKEKELAEFVAKERERMMNPGYRGY